MNTKTNADSLGRLYDAYLPALVRQAQSLCRDADQAQDLALKTLYHANERSHTFAGGSQRAWLGAILRNQFLDDRRRPRPVALDDLDGDVLPDRRPGTEAQALGRLLTEEALARCRDPRLFQAVLDGESLTDYARRTGENVNTVTARFRRDRARLRDLL